VARLVARGRRNRDIAAELGIADKTVEMHVANALGTLGLESRAALAAWIARNDPEADGGT
jgi:non-specific serine/threonine protein kinase